MLCHHVPDAEYQLLKDVVVLMSYSDPVPTIVTNLANYGIKELEKYHGHLQCLVQYLRYNKNHPENPRDCQLWLPDIWQ